MDTTKQRETEALGAYQLYWDSYTKGDLEVFASTLDDAFQMIGTSESEICHSKEEGIEFYKVQMNEVVGKVEMRNRNISANLFNGLFLINEFCDIYILIDTDWTFYSKIRISTLLHETSTGWKVLQQHGSLPDMRVREGETLAFDKISKENLELRDAIKRRTAELENKNRELEIEAALERVRAVAMEMQTPEEMLNVCRIISDELTRFGVDAIRNIQTVIIQEEKGFYGCYQFFTAYQQETFEQTAYQKNPVEQELVGKMLEAKDGYFKGSLTGADLEGFRQHRKKENYLFDPKLDVVDKIFYYFYSIGYGGLGITLYEDLDEEGLHLFKRFHQVFSLAYRRFRDIEKAEAQAREAQIELALERVRARTMAMQKSEELADAAYVLFEQLNILGITHERINIGIVNEENQSIDFWVTEQGGEKLETKFSGRISEPTTLSKAYTAWEKGEKSLVVDLQGEELTSWLKYLEEEIKIPFKKAYLHNRRVQTAGLFSKGMLIVTSPEPLQEEAVYLLEKFARVFDLTYTRFNDLLLAEAQAIKAKENLIAIQTAKSKAEKALAELKSAQAQLIQAEKMASLGELTAGIAHEIQNPLNFVNNFSEVSTELVEELKQEANAENKAEVLSIAADLEQNLSKIHHHGQRADAIVKNMLQHSRSTAGEKQLTNLNALADEYLRLAYHGLRAKDKGFNCTLDTFFDLKLPQVEVVPQDIRRVLLNLYNNAFYAVQQKQQLLKVPAGESGEEEPAYVPTVRVSTHRQEGQVEIRVRDNGMGMPDNVKSKIFQPFFTTKPTGQGTGLGLSLSYDIITKGHGGEIRVETKEGQGSEFIIRLPMV
jgi:signal transduction histidine kinase